MLNKATPVIFHASLHANQISGMSSASIWHVSHLLSYLYWLSLYLVLSREVNHAWKLAGFTYMALKCY